MEAKDTINRNKYMSIEEIKDNLRNSRVGDLRKLNSIDGIYYVFIVSVDWEKMCLNYAMAYKVFRDLKIKVHTVKIKRIKSFRELK